MTERLAFLLFAAVLYTGALIYCSFDYGWTSLAARQAVYVAGAAAIIITIGLLLLALVLWLLTPIFQMLGGIVDLVAIIQARTRRSATTSTNPNACDKSHSVKNESARTVQSPAEAFPPDDASTSSRSD